MERVAVVDGVRRVEARLTLDGGPVSTGPGKFGTALGPTSGVLGAWAVGAATWWPRERRSRITDARVGRSLILGEGRGGEGLDELAHDLRAAITSTPAGDPAALVQALQQQMRQAEAELATDLASDNDLVLADGPLRSFSKAPIVGFIKTQRAHYLPPEAVGLLARLGAGERTPLFAFAGPRYPRWSWYLRLAAVPGGHSWSGIVRLECSGEVALAHTVKLADASALLLPTLAPPLHVDPRAPQNLVPIAALERHLKHLLGDAALAWRRAREVAWAA